MTTSVIRTSLLRVVAAATLLCLAPSWASAQESHADWPPAIHDDQIFWFLMLDELEYRPSGGEEPLAWNLEGWIGDDYTRIWLKSEGEHSTRGPGAGEIEIQALYSRLVSPYFEAQAGIRYDRRFGPGPDLSRVHLALGYQGLAPYWFEVEPTLFVSEDGDVSARLEASYDMLLTQRLILQPDVEIDLAAQTVEEWGVGGGLSEVSVGVRLRYEIRRELAPYLGFGWSQKFGRTAELARAENERVANVAMLFGLRAWF